MINERYQPYIKRVPTIVDQSDEIQAYDSDNLYPQRVEEVRNRSFTLKAATQKYAEFLEGKGFTETAIAFKKIGYHDETANDVLNHISKELATFDGFALHVAYNLNYEIERITPLRFKDCRFGLPDEYGKVDLIKHNTNWERDYNKDVEFSYEIESFPVFDPDPEVLKEQFDYYGIQDYPGQILYYTPDRNQYPLSTFDPVFDKAQAQSDLGVFELANIQEGFVGTTIFKYPGTFETKAEEQKIQEKINQHKGAGGSRIMVAENPSGEADNLFESVSMPNVDRMFELTGKNVKSAIRENYSMPPEILGMMPETGMFNQQSITEAYTYYNSITQPKRNVIERVFNRLFEHYREPLGKVTIETLSYGSGSSSDSSKIFEYHINNGIVDKDEVRSALGLAPISSSEEETRNKELMSKLKIMQESQKAGISLRVAAKLAGFNDEEIEKISANATNQS